MEEVPGRTRAEPAMVRLRSVSWERVQLVLEVDGVAPTLALREEDGPGRMPPTRQWTEGGRTFARFNVLQGPGLQPLAAGRWTLVDAGDRAVDLELGPDVRVDDAVVTDRVLTAPRSSYRVTGLVAGTPAHLTLEVRIGDALQLRKLTRRERVVSVWRRIRAAVWQAAFRLLRQVARRGRPVVLFATRLTPRLAGNLEVVHARMVARGLDRRYELVTIVKPGVDRPLSWRDRLRLFVALARADVIFLDDAFYPVYGLHFPTDVRIVQLWHASGAFKTVGYSRSAVDGIPPFNPWGITHKNTTHAIVSSAFDIPFYAEAFGIPEARLHPTGIPRMDRFFDPDARERALAAAREAIPGIVGHEVWLFAPTYRGDRVATATYDLGRLDLAALHRAAAARDAVVVFKMHPFVRERIDVGPELADRLIEASDVALDVNDLLFSVDLLITDYSSIVFEYSVLGRPMLFFVDDLGAYGSERDFYVPFESFVPGRIVRSFAELLDAIERQDFAVEKVDAFAHRHFAHLDGSSTDRVIDLVLGPGR